ncbi:MAG: hypothetical protein IT328_04415 [Caldilineaceae bacterium]|nr:hypothetical protein [Caldilineaceae bacterium]
MDGETKTPESYASWSILELMGKTVLAGYVTEVSMFGTTMLRIDVPAIGDIPAWSKVFGAAAIFACTPVGEEEAMIVARGRKARPLPTYVLPVAKPMTMRLLEQGRPDRVQELVDMEAADDHTWDDDEEDWDGDEPNF